MPDHWIIPILRQMEDQKVFGAIVIKFRNGKIVLVEEQRTILPPDIQGNDPKEHAHA